MQKPTTVEIQWYGSVWRGAVVGGRGVLTSNKGGTYAGGVAGGTFDGHGVVKWSAGATQYCELAAGVDHRYSEDLNACGYVAHWLHERHTMLHSAAMYPDGHCRYDGKEDYSADDADLVAFWAAAQQAIVRPPQPPPTAPPWGFVRVVRARVPRSAVAFSHC